MAKNMEEVMVFVPLGVHADARNISRSMRPNLSHKFYAWV